MTEMTSNSEMKSSARRTLHACQTANDCKTTRRYPTIEGCWKIDWPGRAALAGRVVLANLGALALVLSVTAAAATASGYSSSVPTYDNGNPYAPSYTGAAARPYSSLNDTSSWGSNSTSTSSSSWRTSSQLNDTPMLNSAPVVHRPTTPSQPSSSTYSSGSTYERPHQWDAEQQMARDSVYNPGRSMMHDTIGAPHSGSSLYRHRNSQYYW